jgi:hypothetical protein
MVVISRWSADDPSPGRVDAALELVTLWAVHLHRCYRLVRGSPR